MFTHTHTHTFIYICTNPIDNMFYKSIGAGIMVFGHTTTSQNLSIQNNVFFEAGCVQTRGDHGAIAFTCPENQWSSGVVSNNIITTCPGDIDPFNFRIPNCSQFWKIENNLINVKSVVEIPIIEVFSSTTHYLPVTASTATQNATLRYTLDGSKPTPSSPIMPESGIQVYWPGKVLAVNVKAFREGFVPSVTQGAVLELNLAWATAKVHHEGHEGHDGKSRTLHKIGEAFHGDDGNVAVRDGPNRLKTQTLFEAQSIYPRTRGTHFALL